MFKKIYPYLIFIFVAYIIWWSPNFWQPDTYFNIGDSLFPFQPAKQTSIFLYAWQDIANEGLGAGQTYVSEITLYYYALMAIFRVFGIPLWICNRLFFFIPTCLLLFASYYMILSFIEGKYRRIGAVGGSIFLTTASPLSFLDPVLHIGIAGMILSFASLTRFLKEQRNRHLVTFAIGFLLMTSMPRYIYVSIILMGFFLVCWCIVDGKSRLKYNLPGVFKLLGIGLVLVILLSFYTFLPTASFLLKHHSSELMPSESLFIDRIKTVDHFKNTTSLFYAARLINFRVGSYWSYFCNPFNSVISFLLLFFLYIPLITNKKICRRIFCILLASLFVALWALIFGSDFYKFLMRVIPGFWIINNPIYILLALALLYSVLLAYSTTTLLHGIEGRAFSIRKTKMLSSLGVIGILTLIVVNNGPYFTNQIPNVRKMFTKGELMRNDLGNHLPYFKIPEGYKMVNGFLPEEDKNARMLVLPFLIDGYMSYSWWPYKTMTEILAQITSLRLSGVSFGPSDRLETIRKLILSEKYDDAISILRFFGYKYIFIHKDMMFYNYPVADDIKFYLTHLPTVDSLETILDNKDFRLYKLKPLQPKMQKQIFLVDGEGQSVEDIISHRTDQSENKLCFTFKKDGKFYVPQGADYVIEAKVSSHLKFAGKKDKIGAEFRFGLEELKDWSFYASKEPFRYSATEDGVLIFTAYFDEDQKGDESVQMRNKNINVDLKKYPYFDLTYKIEDPQVQTIEVVAGIDFDNDGKENEYIRGIYPRPASVEWVDFRYNLFSKAKSKFPNEKSYDLVFLELYPHKLWGVDCSTPQKKGEYTFWIKGVVFHCPSREKFILNDKGILTSPAGFIFHEPIFDLDGEKYWLYKRFKGKRDAIQDMWFRQKIHLEKGRHYLAKLAVDNFEVEWITVEPAHSKEGPEVEFSRVNPTRYEVKVSGAREPFWLVFNQGFHDQWKVYPLTFPSFHSGYYGEGFTPEDIKYLFRKPLDAEHNLVNGYANGWYISPEEMNLPEDFTLVLYFWPQSLFYIGLGVSVLAIIGCVVYLGAIIVKRRREV